MNIELQALGNSVCKDIGNLRMKVKRWRNELDFSEARGTLIYGIAGRAVNSLEPILRQVLKYYLLFCNIDYNKILKVHLDNKRLDKITIGQALKGLDIMNKDISYHLRVLSSEAKDILANRRLVSPKAIEKLNNIIAFRNKLSHNNELAVNEDDYAKNTQKALILVEEVLNDELFNMIFRLQRVNS